MSMQRMFTVVCDSCQLESDSSEWYAALAIQGARREGWAISGNRAVCPECRENGVTLRSLTD